MSTREQRRQHRKMIDRRAAIGKLTSRQRRQVINGAIRMTTKAQSGLTRREARRMRRLTGLCQWIAQAAGVQWAKMQEQP